MTDTRSRGVLARIRDKLTAPAAAAAPVAEPDTPREPEPPVREHLFGSQYRVRVPFDELMRTRGYASEQALRRRLVAPDDAQRQRDAATRRAGYRPGEVVWPSE